MKTQKTLNSQSNFERKNKAGGIMCPNFNLRHKAIVIRTVWYGTDIKTNTYINGNRIESLHIWPINSQQRNQEHTMGK